MLQLQAHWRELGQFEIIIMYKSKRFILLSFSQARAKLKSLFPNWEELVENTARMRSNQAIGYITPDSIERLNLN